MKDFLTEDFLRCCYEVFCLKDDNMTTEYAMENGQSLLEESIRIFIDSKLKQFMRNYKIGDEVIFSPIIAGG